MNLNKTLLLDNIIFDLQKQGGVSNVWKAILKELTNVDFDFKILNNKCSLHSQFQNQLCHYLAHTQQAMLTLVRVKGPLKARFFNLEVDVNDTIDNVKK